MSVDQLIEDTRVFRCLVCRGYFCDPWLSPELASALFCACVPDHHAGWTRFEASLRDLQSLRSENHRLYSAIVRRTGPIATYGEFGCPFMGLLVYFPEHESSTARVTSFARALRRMRDTRSNLARLYQAVHRLPLGLVVCALRFRVFVDALVGFRNPRRQPEERIACPTRRYLLTHATTKGWGSNCVRYGASCQYFAHSVLGADVLPLHEVQRSNVSAFDLVGLFNALDHTSFPLDVLRQLVTMSRHVLIVTHAANRAGKQHLFAFDNDLADFLKKSFAGLAIDDLGEEVDPDESTDYRYLLLTQTRHPDPLERTV